MENEKDYELLPIEIYELTLKHYISDSKGNRVTIDEPIVFRQMNQLNIPTDKNYMLNRLYHESLKRAMEEETKIG